MSYPIENFGRLRLYGECNYGPGKFYKIGWQQTQPW